MDRLSTAEILDYFKAYGPAYVLWLDDSSVRLIVMGLGFRIGLGTRIGGSTTSRSATCALLALAPILLTLAPLCLARVSSIGLRPLAG